MRMIVFFDLPTITTENKREYTRFRKYLIKNGFMMMQESVYCKLLLNQTTTGVMLENLRKNKPSDGLVQALIITEKQYSRMEFIIGEYSGEIINDDKRFIEI